MTAALASVRLTEVLRVARQRNASDVHLAAGLVPCLRVDGLLESGIAPAPARDEIEALIDALLDDAARSRLSSTGDATVNYDGSGCGRVRVHAYRTSAGVALALRLLAPEAPSLDSLRMPVAVDAFAARPHGLIVFAGPTGSGKSTAMAALTERINREQAKHIITVEDPIEYVYRSKTSRVTQREIGRDVPSFADAVYGALRSDPDVLVIGEMRDRKTVHAALTAAETGHLVVTTLHTGDATQTIDRIVGVFAGEMQDQMRLQLAQTLAGVVSMRLIPRLREPGRRSACEILVANDAVRTLIRDGKSHHIRNVIATSRQAGMQTLESHLSELVSNAEISLEQALAATHLPHEVRGATPSLP